MKLHFRDPTFSFELLRAASYGGSEIGEVLATANRIREGDFCRRKGPRGCSVDSSGAHTRRGVRRKWCGTRMTPSHHKQHVMFFAGDPT